MRMLSPTCDSEAKWNTASQVPSASTASIWSPSARSATTSLAPGRHGRAMAGPQIVQHGDLVTPVQQGGNQMAADIAGPAGNQKTLLSSILYPRKYAL